MMLPISGRKYQKREKQNVVSNFAYELYQNVMSDTMTAHRKRGHGYPRQLLICDKWNPGNATGVGIVCPSGRPANYGVASNKLQPKTPTRFVYRRIIIPQRRPRRGQENDPRNTSGDLGLIEKQVSSSALLVCMCIVCSCMKYARYFISQYLREMFRHWMFQFRTHRDRSLDKLNRTQYQQDHRRSSFSFYQADEISFSLKLLGEKLQRDKYPEFQPYISVSSSNALDSLTKEILGRFVAWKVQVKVRFGGASNRSFF